MHEGPSWRLTWLHDHALGDDDGDVGAAGRRVAGERATADEFAVGNIYRTPDLSDRRYGPGGRIEEAEGTRYVHDDDGNRIEKSDILGDTTRYRWNGAGMLSAVELPDGREVSFAYDVLARRLTKQVFETKGAERPLKGGRWSWDGHTPLTELDSDEGKTTWVFEPETFNPLAKLAGGQVWGVLTDQIGTPTELIAQDGSVAWRGEIDTYGKMVSEVKRTKCLFRWPGQMEDDESGLSYNRCRHYDKESSRYLGHDPIGSQRWLWPLSLRQKPANMARSQWTKRLSVDRARPPALLLNPKTSTNGTHNVTEWRRSIDPSDIPAERARFLGEDAVKVDG